MRKFKHYLMIGLVLSGVYGFRGSYVHAQADEKSTFAGLGYSLELPEGWSGKSNYFIEGGILELAFLMPSPVPDLPPRNTMDDTFATLHAMGSHVEAGYWLEELTTQPTIAIANQRFGGDKEFMPFEDMAQGVIETNLYGVDHYDPPSTTSINGMDAEIVSGTIDGNGPLSGVTFSFYSATFQRAGQVVAIISFTANQILPEIQAVFDAVNQSFQFEGFPALEIPSVTGEQTFEGEGFVFDYPAGWTLQPSENEDAFWSTFTADGTAPERAQDFIKTESLVLAPGESILVFVGRNRNTYDERFFSAELLLFAVPSTMTQVGVYEVGNELWAIYGGRAEGYDFMAYAVQHGDVAGTVMIFVAPGEPIDPTPAYTILSSLTIKAGEQGQGIDLPFLPD